MLSISKSIEAPVLVLNQNYQPLNICSARRAIVLMGRGKAESIVKQMCEKLLVNQIIEDFKIEKNK